MAKTKKEVVDENVVSVEDDAVETAVATIAPPSPKPLIWRLEGIIDRFRKNGVDVSSLQVLQVDLQFFEHALHADVAAELEDTLPDTGKGEGAE